MSADQSIRVDPDVCMGAGSCVFHVPHVFAIDPEMNVARVVDPTANPLDDVLDAAEACPTGTIRIDR